MKQFFALLIGVCALSSVYAQNYRLGVSFSPMLQWSGVDNSDFGKDGLKIRGGTSFGYAFGLNVDYSESIESNYAVSTGMQIEYNFQRLNYTYAETNILNGDVNFEKLYRTTFVNFPLALKMRTNQLGRIRYYAYFGLNMPFRVRSREDYESQQDDYKNEDSDDVNFFNPSLAIGIGTEYTIFEKTAAMFGIYYNNGFLNMVSDNDDDRIVFRGFEMRFGIMF